MNFENWLTLREGSIGNDDTLSYISDLYIDNPTLTVAQVKKQLNAQGIYPSTSDINFIKKTMPLKELAKEKEAKEKEAKEKEAKENILDKYRFLDTYSMNYRLDFLRNLSHSNPKEFIAYSVAKAKEAKKQVTEPIVKEPVKPKSKPKLVKPEPELTSTEELPYRIYKQFVLSGYNTDLAINALHKQGIYTPHPNIISIFQHPDWHGIDKNDMHNKFHVTPYQTPHIPTQSYNMSTKSCEKCKQNPRIKGERFCKGCKAEEMSAMQQKGYLQKPPSHINTRGKDSREDTWETKFGINR